MTPPRVLALGLALLLIVGSAGSCAALREPLPPPSPEQKELIRMQRRAQSMRTSYQRDTHPDRSRRRFP